MTEEEFKARTKRAGVRVLKLVEALPNGIAASIIGKQLARAGTSIGANYRAACRAKSALDMIAKLKICEEEADETLYWLELLIEMETIQPARLRDLITEIDEILAMIVTSIKTLRRKLEAENATGKSAIVNRKS